jgi:hypothetical protein
MVGDIAYYNCNDCFLHLVAGIVMGAALFQYDEGRVYGGEDPVCDTECAPGCHTKDTSTKNLLSAGSGRLAVSGSLVVHMCRPTIFSPPSALSSPT